MSKHVAISPEEAADRLAIRELIEAYAHCADRRDAKGQMALFTTDTHFVVYMNAKDPKPTQERRSRLCSLTSTSTLPPCISSGRARSSA
jgi:ketosteroid isomerase-like protein